MIHKLNHGFPSGHVAFDLQEHVTDCLWNHYFSDIKSGIIVNITYRFDASVALITTLVQEQRVDAVLFLHLVDHMNGADAAEIATLIALFDTMGIKHQVTGYTHGHYFPNVDYFDFWALYMDQNFKSYQLREMIRTKITNTYLCYNRKPHPHRIELYDKFSEHGLLEHGIYTLGVPVPGSGHDHPHGVQTYDNNDTHHEHLGDTGYGIAGTTLNVGNDYAWESSLLNIVTETNRDCTAHIPFITEKTYKPILAFRPFIVYGDAGISQYLISNGYQTFNQYFGVSDFPEADELICAVKRLQYQDLDALFLELKPMMLHNYDNFHSHVDRIITKFSITGLTK